MPKRCWTGIGSRKTPADVLVLLERTATSLRQRGWWLRSGHAAGADRACERGAGEQSFIYLPWPGFGVKRFGDDPGMEVLGQAVVPDTLTLNANHALLERLGIRRAGANPTQVVVKLHGRNVCQVMGFWSDAARSEFVLCWCPEVGGEPQGGTASAVKLARHLGVPVFNLLHAEVRDKVASLAFLEEIEQRRGVV